MADVICNAATGVMAVQWVEDGDTVRAQESVCEVECMKVNFRQEAPIAGVITWRVQLGELCNQGDVLAVIEPPSPPQE